MPQQNTPDDSFSKSEQLNGHLAILQNPEAGVCPTADINLASFNFIPDITACPVGALSEKLVPNLELSLADYKELIRGMPTEGRLFWLDEKRAS